MSVNCYSYCIQFTIFLLTEKSLSCQFRCVLCTCAYVEWLCLCTSDLEHQLFSALFATAKAVLVKLQKGGKNQLWVLKQDVHRGKGVHVMKESQAINEVLVGMQHRPQLQHLPC